MPPRRLLPSIGWCLALTLLAAQSAGARAATPGEATDLTITSRDEATGEISLTWTPACAAADHHIVFGLLEDAGAYGYTGQVCGIGATGSYDAFNPGPDSYFFLVIGDDGSGTEGSYGTSFIGGLAQERPEETADPVCAFTQDLSQRCDGPFNPSLGMTAWRPVTGGSGAPFQRWPLAEADELLPGAGIRVNGDDDDNDGTADRDDASVASENDLIEITLAVDPPAPPAGYEYLLSRSSPALRIWTAQTKASELMGSSDEIVLSFTAPTRTLWVESPAGSAADLELSARSVAGGSAVASDQIHFRPIESVVIALGGENQVPADPPLEPTNHGMFQLAITLYRLGYDVHMYDEDVVPASGAGAAYNEVVSAIQRRAVSHVAIFGYSHGGGSTNDLARRLDANRATIGSFSLDFTGYVDGIDNDSDFDIDPEAVLPPSTGYHANWYQHPGCGFLQLCGGPVAGADLNVNVTATPWGGGLTHFTVDDAPQVLQGIFDLLVAHVPF